MWHGNQLTRLEETPDEELTIDDEGKATCTTTYQCRYTLAVPLTLVVNNHPTYPSLISKVARIRREENDYALVTITYEGVIYENPNDSTGTFKTYSLSGGTSTAPIETHRNFLVFAGDPNETTGRIDVLDGDGKVVEVTTSKGAKFAVVGDLSTDDHAFDFVGFSIESEPMQFYPDQARNKAGRRTYDIPTLTYTETETAFKNVTTATIAADMNRLGEIDTPPPSDVLPSVSPNRTWKLYSCEVAEVGEGIRITRKWRLSGPNGHDPDIDG